MLVATLAVLSVLFGFGVSFLDHKVDRGLCRRTVWTCPSTYTVGVVFFLCFLFIAWITNNL